MEDAAMKFNFDPARTRLGALGDGREVSLTRKHEELG